MWRDLTMLEWKEQEHEVNDQEAINDRATMVSLCNCGLLKFFMCPAYEHSHCCCSVWLKRTVNF